MCVRVSSSLYCPFAFPCVCILPVSVGVFLSLCMCEPPCVSPCVCVRVSLCLSPPYPCAIFTYSREIPAAHANPSASLRWQPNDDDDDDANADASVHAYVHACGDAYVHDDDGCAWDALLPLPHSGHALQQLQQRSQRPMPSYDAPAPQPRERQRIRCCDAPSDDTVIGYRLSFIAYR